MQYHRIEKFLVLRLVILFSLLFSGSSGSVALADESEPTTTPPTTLYLPFASGETAVDSAEIDETTAQGGGSGTSTSVAGVVDLAAADTPPVLTPEQLARFEASLARSNLPGPKRSGISSADASGEPLNVDTMATEATVPTNAEEELQAAGVSAINAPPDAQILRNVVLAPPAGFTSNVSEGSVAQGGRYAFFTHNWYAARSTNGGSTWSYISPYADMADFCCDQVTIYDNARDLIIWYRQGSANASGVNRIRVGISSNGGASFCNYDFAPTNFDSSWTNQWFDYPHLQLGADKLYIATNLFNASDVWQRSVMIRLDLDQLAACGALNWWYYWNTAWFTFVPVQNADHIMYFASNWPTASPFNRLAIWTWPEGVAGLPPAPTIKTVTAWTNTNRGDALCGSTSGNWAARTDDRLLTGARYMIHGSNLQIKGRKILAWWWNVQEGGNFARPYIDGAAFYEDTLVQVAGNQGRPYIWNSSTCFLYPSAAANKRGDLGLVFNYSTGTALNPSLAFAIADDYTTAPPGFTYFGVRSSNRRPSDNRWGDYNTVRPFYPGSNTWVAAGHYINNTADCSSCGRPVYFAFGRGRDNRSWSRWLN